MTNIYQDIHTFLRYSISGYLFIVIMLLYLNYDYIYLFTKNISALSGLMTAFLVLGWILGFIFSSLFRFVFNVGWREKHFLDIIPKMVSKNNSCSFWESELINDKMIYQKIEDNDFQIERDRITFLTSKFYMFGSIVISLVLGLLLIAILKSYPPSLSVALFLVLFTFFTVYSLLELLRNYNLVKEFNKHLIQKIILMNKKINGG